MGVVGLLWEVIPRAEEGCGDGVGILEKNDKWKERKPIQGCIIEPVTIVDTWSLVLLNVL